MGSNNMANTAAQVPKPQFHFYAAIGTVLTAFLGFTPTYFSPMVRGSFSAHPIIHLHGIIFFSWTMYFAFQSWLVANNKTVRHRDVGLIGISMATAMLFLGLLAAVDSAKRAAVAGFAQDGIRFMIVPVSGVLMFALLVGLAIFFVKNKDLHKRLMLIATASILDAAIARLFLTFVAPPPEPGASPVPPLFVATPPAMLADLFIIAGMIYDWRTRRRVHPVYFFAGGAVLAIQLGRVSFAETLSWNAVAQWLLHAAG
jgi:hypothetical protein